MHIKCEYILLLLCLIPIVRFSLSRQYESVSLLTFLMFITACSSNSTQTVESSTAKNKISNVHGKLIDSTYMRTGFYFLAEKGISMHLDKSNEIYTISPSPFASVENVIKTKIEKTQLKNGDYTELCMTFDKIGTENLTEGTGNPLHPKIAVVVANHLLYVVENTTSIKTGVMCVGLVGYSEKEMEEMRHSVDIKR